MSRRAGALLCVLAAAALAGCGADDEPAREGSSLGAPVAETVRDDFAARGPSPRERAIHEAQSTIEGVVAALNRRDPAVCESFTTRFLEASTNARGAFALDACRRAVRRQRGPRQQLVAFRRARFREGVVSLSVEVASGIETRTRHVRLVPSGAGTWLIDLRR